jgi:hypothetical protein
MICSKCLEIIVAMAKLRETSQQNHQYLMSRIPTIKDEPIDTEPMEMQTDEYEEIDEGIVNSYCEFQIAENPAVNFSSGKVKEEPADEYEVNYDEDESLLEEKPRLPMKKMKIKREKKKKPLTTVKVKTKAVEKPLRKKRYLKDRSNKKRNHCHRCKNHFERVVDLNDHLKIHEIDATASKVLESGREMGSRECAKCGMKFNQLSVLLQHWEATHDKTLNPFSCSYCYDRFISRDLVIDHLISYHRDCSVDGSIVFVKRNLQAIFSRPTHLAKHTRNEESQIKLRLKNLTSEQLDDLIPASFKAIQAAEAAGNLEVPEHVAITSSRRRMSEDVIELCEEDPLGMPANPEN